MRRLADWSENDWSAFRKKGKMNGLAPGQGCHCGELVPSGTGVGRADETGGDGVVKPGGTFVPPLEDVVSGAAVVVGKFIVVTINA